ncbi:MAG TPA: BTAD domain-containing putative transcriptional regulator [Acidimicrobiales bacterium]|nr:BTAD domain-containing putative transcriptional regulator [Acidimicrobiales bacterium]
MIEIGILGPLRLRAAGADVGITGRRERCVLAVLALHAGHAVSTTALFDHLWGDRPPRTANKSLQTAVANLRRITRDTADEGWLETSGAGYRLNVAHDGIDLLVFEAQVDAGRRALGAGAAVPALQQLNDGLGQWRGDTPADLGDGLVADIEANRLVELRLDAMADRADAELRCGHPHRVLAELGALCDTWPLRERFHELLMLALYRAGRQGDALAAYQRLRATLIDQGLEPGGPVRDLERRILDHDPSLDHPAPVPSSGGRPSRAPPARPLIGRERALRDIDELLGTQRLITLVGPGGVGKTVIAEHLAAHPGDLEAVWCGLGAVPDAEHLLPAVATALGIDQRVGVTMVEAVCDRLQLRPTLLVLDNCEHLLDPIAELVETLTRTCGRLVVLATSRERLSIPVEAVWSVDGLEVPEADIGVEESAAGTLFLERAKQSDPHFFADASALASIAAICRGLDGLPLALELAAARVRALPPGEIAKRLDDRFELFTGGRRGADERHRSLRATVAWSYDLLAERERRLFRRLGTFAGAFTIEAAEAVGALDDLDPAEVPALLADLVDKSMVVVSRDGSVWHYRLLETLRAYARDELDSVGEGEAVDLANMAYHRDLVRSLGTAVTGPAEADAVAAIEAAFDNVRQAVALARRRHDADTLGRLVAGLFAYLHFRPRWEASVWAEDALELFDRVSPLDLRCRTVVAAAAAWGRWFAGDLDRAEAIVERLLLVADPDDPGLADVLATQAVVRMYRQDPRAVGSAADALGRAVGDDRRWLAAYLSGQIAIMHAYAGDAEAATPYLERQGRLVGEVDNDSTAAWWLYCRAEVSGETDPMETVRLARQGIDAAVAARSGLLENITRITAVTVEARHGDVWRTLEEFALLIDRFRRSGAWTHLMVVLWNLIEAFHKVDAHHAAAVLLHVAPAGAPVPYGDQLARLDQIRNRLAHTMPADRFDEAAARGSALSREQTAEFALSALAALVPA